jgi:hypothetical protein
MIVDNYAGPVVNRVASLTFGEIGWRQSYQSAFLLLVQPAGFFGPIADPSLD